MKNFITFFATLALLSSCGSNKAPSIVPLPQEITMSSGSFTIKPNMKVNIQVADEADKARLFDAVSALSSGIEIVEEPSNADIVLIESGEGNPEGYKLTVESNGINIEAPSAAGIFYGIQTLAQSIEPSGKVPAMTIVDAPRLAYRGLMVDVSRHFRDADFLRKQIDAMTTLKLNRLHLHLTDAAGWRIEIESHPELCGIAAWRPQETWKEWCDSGMNYCEANDPRAQGGYLTKQEIRDLIKYAEDRYITIIPEIELPSHSEEVTAVIPELRCDVKRDRYPDFCVGNEQTFAFLQDVLAEVIELFPSEYIHIGGDEASKQAWKECKKCQARMKKEGLENVDELQSYMIHRIEKWVNEQGRNIIGWDEILEGGLAPNATVMSWRGTEGGEKAAADGHDAIMVPGAYCYLDSYQDAPNTQPEAFGGYLPLEKVYSYNPTPEDMDAEVANHIIGVQGNIWGEKIPTAEYMEYLLYPRLFAIAEIGWTPQDIREWDDFHARAIKLTDKFREKGYNAFDLKNEIGNKPESKNVVEHLAVGKKVEYNVPYWNAYPAQKEQTLTDGVKGGWNYNDGKWQGFLYKGNERLDVTIDLEAVQPIEYIGAEFMQMCGPDVWMPQEVVISVSTDGQTFTELSRIKHEQVKDDELTFKIFDWQASSATEKVDARYVRYQAYANKGVQFVDEIIVR